MNWNEWRKLCSKNNLSLAQASKTYQNYKELRENAENEALEELLWLTEAVHLDGEEEEKEQYNPVEEILEAKEQLVDLFTGEAMLEQDAIELFEKADKVSEDLLTSLKEIKSKRDYHDHMAKMLTQEAKDMVQEIIKEVRRAF